MLTLFVVGLFAGALLSAMVLWLASGLTEPLPSTWRYASVAVVAVLGLLRELGVIRIPLPQNARQVPQDVLQRNLLRGALQFGFELGTGVRTYVSASTPYVLAAAILLAGQDPLVAALAGLGFGAGRAATPLVRLASGSVDDWDDDLRVRLRVIAIGGGAVAVITFALLLLHGL